MGPFPMLHLLGQCVHPTVGPTLVRVSWMPGQPWVTSWTFIDSNADEVCWEIDRALLVDALNRGGRFFGDGHIRVARFASVLMICLSSNTGDAIVHVEARHLAPFIAHTLGIVPVGPAESAIVLSDIDRELQALLGGANG